MLIFDFISYVERMAQQQIPKGVCIYQKSMTASANKVKQANSLET
jgi:DNA-directed RNA polymerase I, II, and III subunit RPABC1